MTIKIYNNIGDIGQVYVGITEGLLDYAPSDIFSETFEMEEADIILIQGVFTGGSLRINALKETITLKNADEVLPKLTALNKSIRILWVDATGPDIYCEGDVFSFENSGLRETDFIISPATVPPHPNLCPHLFHVEKSVFRRYCRFERSPCSVMISNDNINDDIELIAGIMPVVSKLHVTKAPHLSPPAENTLKEHEKKISVEHLSYPKGIVYKASQCEFVLHTHTTLGVEMMGIEAGMTGCQPIYPDTEYYRDIFDDTGVLFYDTQDAVNSLRNIIDTGSTFTPEQVEAFRTRFSAEDNLPAFWESVYNIHSETLKESTQ